VLVPRSKKVSDLCRLIMVDPVYSKVHASIGCAQLQSRPAGPWIPTIDCDLIAGIRARRMSPQTQLTSFDEHHRVVGHHE
jgi:hypothetical protein